MEPNARNTGENINYTRALLDARGIAVWSVTLISRLYQQRRAYATCRLLWPDIDVYAERGFAVLHPMPDDVRAAFQALVHAGYTIRLV